MTKDNGELTSGAPAAQGRRRTTSPEIQAMAKIDNILSDLPLLAQNRIVDWLSDLIQERTDQADLTEGADGKDSQRETTGLFQDVGDL